MKPVTIQELREIAKASRCVCEDRTSIIVAMACERWAEQKEQKAKCFFDLPKIMVLQYQPELTHSVWVDLFHRCRTKAGMARMLRRGMASGQWVGYRLFTLHAEGLDNHAETIVRNVHRAAAERNRG